MARHKILTFTVMYFIQAWTLGVDSKMVHLRQPGLHSPIPLDMVPNSVDDKYKRCTEKMYKKVQEEYLPNENSTEGIFKQAWMKAERCAKNVTQRFEKDKSKYNSKDKLTHDHIKAICAYTAEKPDIYSVFNQAVRTNRTEYTTSFHFHSLHFLLTDAIRLLKLNQLGCHTTYRRTKVEFVSKVNKVIRFGFFASSSLDKEMSKNKFGDKSCFEIKTCFGADLKSFPKLGNHEKEVLIPPYEVFKVIAVLKKENDRNLWCDVVYKLKNIKAPRSNLNCKLFKKTIIH
ncbi:NADP+--arginine ADP-ribosyltransferase 1 precursor [Salmo salar]|uniref:NAD(P)(+)--arginine ADP-ribosyltransferase n=1 Tax=Salmo salar TaxID=8030 RepID=B5XBG0_SALSA|nr:NADP+--arginine ADP-ribosyltransferase 1 precursor [Salmo salar]ACI68180.1 NADP+--arginine ADP-ribosyltransferase 1 precursor [Salmo salar]|eukprot:NP_001134607.1 NADP+--arginine ADP-ribosyltransferase 1 precursor [Salmo salar]